MELPIDILVIPDAHWRQSDRLDRAYALGRFIMSRRPQAIVWIGDWWDMPSLAAHKAPSPLGTGDQPTKREGLRVVADIESGCQALDAVLSDLNRYNARQRRTGHHERQYKPRMVFLAGNHEERLERIPKLHPALQGFIDDQAIADAVARRGIEWHPYLRPVKIAGITFAHCFESPGNRKPIQIGSWPAKLPFSAVWGHTHQFHHRTASLPFRQSISALCAGTFRSAPPPDAPHEWSGVVMLHDAHDGEYDLEQISTDRLLREFDGRAAA
ncbi:MAG TPA: hypothetical protein PKA33_14050 [Amaricoccus sp.]|uniref:hypothetical protein n=1 Tax=Amaricoccus sp. TaxID=1872485 RepID=UPI002CB0EC64|nr:hypothetical protein [Amaricoccus sp.]HMQ93532.1 hypothetical protein [Amaricoccus sp.]HMR53469.1 hypothetical protein [Amaricoccus sp.]HMR58954.1 hypothetical protein [Amaricoccus sp.]HMU00473.1 hypothetical protein [Amaricoccus sp.]